MSAKTPVQIVDTVIDQMREDLPAFRDGQYTPNQDQWHDAMVAAVEVYREQLREEASELRAKVNSYEAAAEEPDDDPGYHRRIDAALNVVEPARKLIEVIGA